MLVWVTINVSLEAQAGYTGHLGQINYRLPTFAIILPTQYLPANTILIVFIG